MEEIDKHPINIQPQNITLDTCYCLISDTFSVYSVAVHSMQCFFVLEKMLLISGESPFTETPIRYPKLTILDLGHLGPSVCI